MSPMRKRIAERLVASQQTTASLTTFNEIDMSEVIALRKKHQECWKMQELHRSHGKGPRIQEWEA